MMFGLLQLLLGLGGITRERHGEQAVAADGLAGQFADAVGAGMDALDGGLHFGQRLLLVRDQTEGEVAVKGVGAGVGHVLAVAGEIAGVLLGGALERLFGVLAQRLEHVAAEVEEELVITAVFLRHIRRIAIVRGRLPGLVGIEAEDVGEGSGLDMVGNRGPAGTLEGEIGLGGVPGACRPRVPAWAVFLAFFFAISRTSSRLNAMGLVVLRSRMRRLRSAGFKGFPAAGRALPAGAGLADEAFFAAGVGFWAGTGLACFLAEAGFLFLAMMNKGVEGLRGPRRRGHRRSGSKLHRTGSF